jgi:predicted phage terminase large subunit-like protein
MLNGELEVDIGVLLQLPREELVERAKAKAALDTLRLKQRCQENFSDFVKEAWSVVEPNDLVWGWHMDAICMHLEAVAEGDINRLLINVPPGMSKSMLTSVLFPAWVWTTRPEARFLCCSHGLELALRDSVRCRRLIQSEWYQGLWPVELVGDQNAEQKFENSANGFRQAIAASGITGARADHIIVDDPHSVDSAASEVQRQTTADWFLEALPTRLNNPMTSSITVIMQRLHQEDVSGIILDKNLGYEHLMLPMRFDPMRKCQTSIGFEDIRTDDGELLFPDRFPEEVVARDEAVLGPFAVAGQFQQTPSPRGGGIIKREWWMLWDDETAQANGVKDATKYPPMDYIIASLDGAYTEKEENDPSALTIWGVWQRGGQSARRILSRAGEVSDILDDRDTIPSLMLMYAFEKRLPIHGPYIERVPGETDNAFKIREQLAWGLVEHVINACNKYNVDRLLIESKGPGLSVAQEIQRLNRTSSWSVELINPGNADKVARTYAVQATFANGTVYAPDKDWAEKVIIQFEQFPKAKHDDLVDSSTQALKYLRERNLLRRPEEVAADIKWENEYKPKAKIIYDV